MGFWDLFFGTGESTAAPRLDPRGRIGVMLESDGGNKIAAIKAVRELTGIGLAEAKDLVESAPCRVGATDAQSTADSAVAWLTRAGARASLLREQPEAPRPVQQASVRLVAVGSQKIAVIKAVRDATGWGLAETKGWVESAPVVLDCGDHERALALLLALTDAGAEAEIA